MPKILAIDDKRDNLVAISALLRQFIPGCDVVTAGSGPEGIEKAREDPPDTILLDIIMPGMDGYEVCRVLKSMNETGHIPVIILTAIRTDSESRVKGLETGADAFLTKPVDGSELAAQVKAMLRIKRAEDLLRREKNRLEDAVRERTRALQESKARYKGVFEYTKDGVAVYMAVDGGEDFIILDFNRSAEEIEGVKREEIVGRSILEVFPGVLEFGLFRVLQRVWKTGRPEHFPVALYRDEKRVGWRENFVYRLPTGEVVSVYSDETERVEREEALRENEARFRALVESSTDHIFMLDRNGRYLFSNDREEKFGFPKGESIRNRSLMECFPGEASDIYLSHLDEVHATGMAVDFDHDMPGTDGLHHYRVTLYPIMRGGEIWAVGGICRDITGAKRGKEELRRSEEKFSKLFEASPAWIAFTTLEEGRFLEVNRAFSEVTGYEREEVIGRTSIEMGLYADPRERERYLKMARDQGGFREEEVTLLKKTGEPVRLLWSAEKIQLDGEPCVISVFLDITDRKRAEEDLRRSEEKFSKLFRTSPVWMAITNLEDGRYVDVNEAFTRMTGYLPEEVIGRTSLEIGLWVDPLERDRYLKMALSRGGFREEEVTFRKKDGEPLHLLWSAETTRLNGENCLINVLVDITDRKRAEESLRESESYVRSILKTVPTGIGMVHNRYISWVSDRLIEMIGYTGEELIGKSARILYETDEEFDRVGLVKYGQIMEHGVGQVETRFKCRDGQIKDILMRSTPIDPGDLSKGVVFTALDITDRRRSEEARVLLATAVEQAAELMVITDPEGVIQYVNPSFEQVTGYSREEAVGKNPRILKSGKHDAGYYRDLWDTIRRGEVWRGGMINRKKDGTLYEEEATISPVMDGEGNVVNFVGVKRDVTHEARLERQLQQAQKMEAIGTLAGGIAHDFNNLLGVIIGYGEMIEMFDLPEESPVRPRLKELLRASHRAKDLVRQILTFSRRTEQELKPVQLAYIMKETLKFLRSSLPATIEIRQHIGSSEGNVLADPTQMHQVLMNLCTNASHAMRERGGVLEVRLFEKDLAEGDEETSLGLGPGAYLCLTVSDTGRGMAPEVTERIFDPYFTTKEKGEGTGLGLAVVHGIVKSCGGAIYVQSELGMGTLFRILLPRLKREKGYLESVRKATLPGGKERILFVDDEKALSDLGKEILEKLGYEVMTRTSGVEALEAMRADPWWYDLVITDQTMPNMTGSELAKAMLKIRPDMPVILCTGYSELITPEEAAAIGVRDFLLKPVTAEKLALSVRNALDQGAGDPESPKGP